MKKIFFLISVCLLSMSIFSQTKNFIDQPYIETRAKVDTLVSPDRIYLSFLIAESDTKGKISVEELENKMAETLKSLGINLEKQLMLNDLASNFKKYLLKQQDVLKTKAYTLIVYNGLTAGKVIVALEKINIANVNLEKTEYSKIEELQLKLKSQAILKAKKQAEVMLTAINQKAGKAIFIADENLFYSGDARDMGIQMAYASKVKEYEPIEIQFEKIKVESTIRVNFIIE